jgi:hypothetical protein
VLPTDAQLPSLSKLQKLKAPLRGSGCLETTSTLSEKLNFSQGKEGDVAAHWQLNDSASRRLNEVGDGSVCALSLPQQKTHASHNQHSAPASAGGKALRKLEAEDGLAGSGGHIQQSTERAIAHQGREGARANSRRPVPVHAHHTGPPSLQGPGHHLHSDVQLLASSVHAGEEQAPGRMAGYASERLGHKDPSAGYAAASRSKEQASYDPESSPPADDLGRPVSKGTFSAVHSERQHESFRLEQRAARSAQVPTGRRQRSLRLEAPSECRTRALQTASTPSQWHSRSLSPVGHEAEIWQPGTEPVKGGRKRKHGHLIEDAACHSGVPSSTLPPAEWQLDSRSQTRKRERDVYNTSAPFASAQDQPQPRGPIRGGQQWTEIAEAAMQDAMKLVREVQLGRAVLPSPAGSGAPAPKQVSTERGVSEEQHCANHDACNSSEQLETMAGRADVRAAKRPRGTPSPTRPAQDTELESVSTKASPEESMCARRTGPSLASRQLASEFRLLPSLLHSSKNLG